MKPKFIHKPRLVKEFRGDDGLMKYSMDSDLVFFDGKENIVTKAVSENGVFLTNLASIPTWLHWLMRPDNKWIRYSSAQHDNEYDNPSLFKRVKSDWRFLKATKAEGCPFLVRWIAFIGIRLFGSSYRG